MTRGTLKYDLIKSIGHADSVLEIEYTDGTVFQYSAVPFAVFKKVVRSKSPGATWLNLRDDFRFKRVPT
jgi:hypothetical protein